MKNVQKICLFSNLLSNDDIGKGSLLDLPTNDDALLILKKGEKTIQKVIAPVVEYAINDQCVVLWNIDTKLKWIIAYIKDIKENKYLV